MTPIDAPKPPAKPRTQRVDYCHSPIPVRAALGRLVQSAGSINAIAKRLGLGHHTIEAAMTGHRLISRATILVIETALGLPPSPVTQIFRGDPAKGEVQ